MLHWLRNDEIYPHFWRLRERQGSHSGATEFAFLDLDRLKSLFRDPVLRDEDVERILYGTEEHPHFSGWTLKRLERTLERSGYSAPRVVGREAQLTRASAEPTNWSRSDANAWRREQKIWELRKALRAKAGEARARFKSFFVKPNLAAGDAWLNLGAGAENYERYVKVDLAGSQHVYDNVVTLAKIPDGSVSRIYCNHVLEHIPLELIQPMLRRWRQVLKPGGELRARMPDARQAVLSLNGDWVETTEAELARLGFPNFLEREASRAGRLDDDSCVQTVYGWSNSTPHAWDLSNQHKSLWTPKLARERFERAGFTVTFAENLGTLNTAIVAQR